MQTVITLKQGCDDTNPEATMPWLDHIKSVTKKIDFDPTEVGVSKPKGSVFCDLNTAGKEGTLSYFWFCQLSIEH